MWVGSVDILGLAWIKTICSTNGQSSSAIEEMGDYSSIITAAHELGHSLSAQHDGYLNFCSFEDRYLMASSDSYPTQLTRQHPWRFSYCTVNYIVSYLTLLSDT
uniref:Peptidase M12B domain-containing protein n=1 Tax=Biomphalaria glabrata TaxID=6526 RepID=A0A2C9M111_BIOGL